MKIRTSPSSPLVALAATALAAAMAVSATAATTIGVNFVKNGSGIVNTDTNSLLATDVAGVPNSAQANWNNLGRYGDSIILVDSAGAASGVTISWDASGTWSQAGGGTPTVQGTPDGNLMNSYLDSNGSAATTLNTNLYSNSAANKPLIYLSGLSAWLAAQGASYYDVILYADGDVTSGRTAQYWPMEATGPYTNMTFGSDLWAHVYRADYSNFVTTLTYWQVPRTATMGGLAAAGNYIVFDSLSADSILLRAEEYRLTTGTLRAPVNAIQIVPRTAPPLLPSVIPAPTAVQLYPGETATLTAGAGGRAPLTFQWQKNGAPISNGGNLAGTTTDTLVISNVAAGDTADYSVVVSNVFGAVTSSVVPLSLAAAPAAGSYAEKTYTNAPYAYWRFNDAGDPSTNAIAFDYVGGHNGTYGYAANNNYNGIIGPRPAAFPGFESGNAALQSSAGGDQSWVTVAPINLNTNTVTITAWIYPTATVPTYTGLVFTRVNGDASGLGFGGTTNTLGYTWNNNNSATYNFYSGLVVPENQWSFVALVVNPTNAILYLFNAKGSGSATNSINHNVEGFAGPLMIGSDNGNLARVFPGSIDEVTIFNRSLTGLDLYNFYKKGLGLTAIAPVITVQPQPAVLYAGRTAHFTVTASGDTPFTYQWRKAGGDITGATTSALAIPNVSAGDQAAYDVIVRNIAGSATSASASLTVLASNAAPVAYEAAVEAANPVAYWRFNEASGSTQAYDYWGGNIATNVNVTTGVPGPLPPDFPGYENTNSAYSFDGFTMDTDTGVGFLNNLPQFSIIGWFNPAAFEPARTGLFGQNDAVEFGFNDATDLMVYTARGGSAAIPQSNINPTQWYFTAAVGDGTKVTLYLFTTGAVWQASSSVATTNYGNSAFPFRIGGGGILDASANYFNGQIDEVAVFNRALSAGELSTMFGAAVSPSGVLTPQITVQPSSVDLFAGRTAKLTVGAVGTTLQYQWRKDGLAIGDAGNVSGAATASLTLAGLVATNAGGYDVVISNSSGSVTSVVASVTVITPVAGSFASQLIATQPLAYWRLNETSGTNAFDFYGGHNGTYQSGATMGVAGVRNPPWVGFESTNVGIETFVSTASSYVSVPFGALSTNNVTFAMWVYPLGLQESWSGLLMTRGNGTGGGMGYNDQQMLAYTWNNNSAATYNFASGLVIPSNQWSFVAMVLSPTNAILYLDNGAGERSATNVLAHNPDTFGNQWQIGHDDNSANNNGTRTFNGFIDEVSVFNYALSPAQIHQLFLAGSSGAPVTLAIQRSGADVILTWPRGTLQQADTVDGQFTDVPSNPTSPFQVTPAPGAQKFYRVHVQ